ncbi:uncharacterized protein LOC132992848 isoform X1 [Labrus mixtus]|uniref:uncharacterized protein LOC132992848 isoform X1 n=1 Tax=Labrus mixtus TaxID=508554 RepID=UPI0029C0C86D|nr:uncharacterized protein LOC132992848 isoform X1 [Labrus mixtus]
MEEGVRRGRGDAGNVEKMTGRIGEENKAAIRAGEAAQGTTTTALKRTPSQTETEDGVRGIEDEKGAEGNVGKEETGTIREDNVTVVVAVTVVVVAVEAVAAVTVVVVVAVTVVAMDVVK